VINKRKFDSKKVLKKTVSRLNVGTNMRYAGVGVIGISGIRLFAEMSKARTQGEMQMAFSGLIGGVIAGFAIGLTGNRMKNVILKKLIGKPIVCRKIANDIQNKEQRMFVRVLGHVDWKNKTVRDAFRVSYVSGRATQTARNIVERETARAMKKAEYDEALAFV